MLHVRRPKLIYEVAPATDEWVLTEDKVPESRPHDLVAEQVRALLVEWARRKGRRVAVCRNLAIRWEEERPQVGVDPDVCVIEPPPPEGDDLYSLRLWDTGHYAPMLAVEIVSESRVDKDYSQSPEKYAANGTKELWVFDPKLVAPKVHGKRFRIQVWRRVGDSDAFQRVYAGEGPAWSEAVQGWLFAASEGRRLRIADDKEGTSWWMTREEAERAAKEAERAAKEAERAAKEEAQHRAERLAAKLRELGIDPDAVK